MNRPSVLQVGGTLYWVILTRDPDTMVLKDADSTPTVAVRKNGASTADSVTVTKRSATTGIYDCSYNPASEVEGDKLTFEESATVTGTTTSSATYRHNWDLTVVAVERGTDSAATSSQATAIEADTQDIQSRLPTALTGGIMTSYVQGLSNSAIDAISGNIAFDIINGDLNWPAAVDEIAGEVWDEPYASHTTSGTFGKLMDILRKSNLSIDGTVSNAITPTTLTFSSNVSATTSAYAHAVLLFVSGPLTGENSPVVSYDNTNGVFVLEEPLTAAPSSGDEFVVIAGSHVHAIADIQNGLATSAGVTAAFTEIKGATWDSGTDTLEAIRNASGGGGGISALLPAIGVVPVRVDQTMLTAFVGETIDVAIVVYQSDGTTPMDLSSKTLEVCFESTSTTDVAVVSNANITVSGDDNNIVTFAYPSAVTASVSNYHWSLRDASSPKTVWQYGTLYVKRAALKDA